ncbi:E3 ubiquitin-protein ligase [Phytophthora cinnamomi]|uniref:E3 ubiquitin-protein ligase n=1 Tax=Phytophthora cinnamomi TaxID=4785 RepID=UPI00355AC9D4|nr:E3 ubiquitin-protein ligase [Phytophthora cinnamomi]KAG6611388.1 E3 ubiquitin-protein ligase [Phytophthora cinnamomi]
MKSSGKLAAADAMPSSSSSRSVVIHVFDEYRKSSKEFTCQRDLLLAKMKYFQAYLNEANEHDEIDISVHCDVEIFELLMEYMHQRPDHEWRPRITLENIASILVSSEFLQMEELVEECVAFISTRVQDFMLLRVDFGCLSDTTIAKIAGNCTPEQLQTLHDPKDKILSKLRRKKVEALVKTLQEGGRRLELCANCELLFIKDDQESAGCQKGKRQIGVHGELVGWHQAKTGWQVETFLRELGANKGISWSAAYWYIWGSTKCFHCSVCKQKCSLLELRDCAYHPGSIVDHGPAAKYSCCSARIFSADEISVRGCKTTAHVPLQGDKNAEVDSFSNVVAAPNMWEQIRACEKIARAQGPPSSADAGGGGRVDVASLFPPPQTRKSGGPVVEREPSSRRLNTAGDGNSLGYRKQCRVLQLQEKDRVRCQEIARQLVQQRKKATS